MWLVELFHSYLPPSIVVAVGPWQLHWYGLMMAGGIAAGYIVTRFSWRKRGWQVQPLDELMILLVISGLIGARLLDVFVYEWWYFKTHLVDILYVWQGGLAWHGALLGAVPVLWWWARRHHYVFWEIIDSFVPGLALGQALGRWGNYFNQELFGLPTSLPWGIPIAESARPIDFAVATYFHPVFLYEFIGLLLMAFLLWRLGQKLKINGRLLAVYLVASGLLRFALEFLRLDEQNIFFGWRAGSWVAMLTILVGVWLYWFRLKRSSGSLTAKHSPE